MAEIIKLHHRHDQPGYFSLAELPQRGSVAKQAFGSGWWELDQIFKFYLGQFVVVTGIAGHGKSTFLLNVLVKIAREKGVRSFMYVPENEAYLRDKLLKIWGDEATFEHFAESQCFVQSAVPDAYDGRPKTLDWVLEKAVVAIERDKVEVVLIDPWNELERAKPRDMLMTDYIGECLMMLKQFCRTFNVVVIMVAHPTKAVNENGGRVAGLADIEGSMNGSTNATTGLWWCGMQRRTRRG
jgi:twinkle protein